MLGLLGMRVGAHVAAIEGGIRCLEQVVANEEKPKVANVGGAG